MGWFVFAIIFGVLAVIAFVIAAGISGSIRKEVAGTYSGGMDEDELRIARGWTIFGGVILLALGGLFMIFSTVYTQGVGEAKVIINLDGTVAGSDLDPGFGTKAPWQDAADFDLFSQEVLYAGGDTAPSYSGGQVNGKEVTVSVGGINGGSTQANVDISIVYSLDADEVEAIYKKYKSQERFTKQVVEKTILSVVRQVPSDYTAIEFRGGGRAESADKMLDILNDKLNANGISIDFVNIQDIRYSDTVQAALNEVENANQAIQKAEAEQRRIEVEAQTRVIEAQGLADAAVAKAQGDAEANAILTQSLTPEVLQQRYIDALAKGGTIYVVPEGSQPLVNVGQR